MALPLTRPIAPMLARPGDVLPAGQHYEPKWDGFRCLVFRDGEQVHLDSRNGREITRFFPEVVQALSQRLPPRCVLDGEIIRVGADGALDFPALQLRLHPATSRIDRLAAETPCQFIAFDLLAVADDDLTEQPFSLRRQRLVDLLPPGDARVLVTPATADPAIAERWFTDLEGAGLDGVIAKAPDLTYQPGKRVMTKLKHRRTADCVVAGYRPHTSGPELVGSLLLGLWSDDGLVPVGVVGALPMARRRELVEEFAPLVCDPAEHPWAWADLEEAGAATGSTTGGGSRWSPGKSLRFVPLRPERVLQVRYDSISGGRFRHLAQFDRWRPDRDPKSCDFEQLDRVVPADLRRTFDDLR